jgi:hypothetical protein
MAKCCVLFEVRTEFLTINRGVNSIIIPLEGTRPTFILKPTPTVQRLLHIKVMGVIHKNIYIWMNKFYIHNSFPFSLFRFFFETEFQMLQ